MQVIIFKIVGLVMESSTLSLTRPISNKLEIVIVVIWFWSKRVIILFLFYLDLNFNCSIGFDVSD
jgi:hypothetical protein